MVEIKLISESVETPEYNIGIQIRNAFAEDLKDVADGKIIIATNVTFYGQETKDLDIFIFGKLGKGYKKRLEIPQHSKDTPTFKNVYIGSFCFAIDIRHQQVNQIKVENENVYVTFNEKLFNVTDYSFKQKFAANHFLEDTIQHKIFVCGFTNFTNLDDTTEIEKIDNLIAGELTIDKLFQKALYQKGVLNHSTKESDWWGFDILNKNFDKFDSLESAIVSFTQIKENIGQITKQKLENLTEKAILRDQEFVAAIGKMPLIIKGGAGTGKTMKLIKIAKDLYDAGNRCLILTYNKMLVNDLNRLTTLAGIKNAEAEPSILVQSIHFLMKKIMTDLKVFEDEINREASKVETELESMQNEGKIDFSIKEEFFNNFKSEYFIENYHELLVATLTFVNANKSIINNNEEIKKIKRWDYILIDEGQDWLLEERELLYAVFGDNNFIVTDGLNQLIRTNNQLQWDIFNSKKIQVFNEIKGQKSLRQKSNLCAIQEIFARKTSIPWKINPNEQLLNGNIIITTNAYSETIHFSLLEKAKKAKNDEYDGIMFLVPPSLTTKETKLQQNYSPGKKISNKSVILKRNFILREEWAALGINILDGTNIDEKNQSRLPTNKEHRLMFYESCRGLEAWCVVCLNMDEFFENKISNFNNEHIKQGDLFKDAEDRAIEYAANWCLMVFSRPVDTLVITLKDENSRLGKLLKEVAMELGPIVNWIK